MKKKKKPLKKAKKLSPRETAILSVLDNIRNGILAPSKGIGDSIWTTLLIFKFSVKVLQDYDYTREELREGLEFTMDLKLPKARDILIETPAYRKAALCIVAHEEKIAKVRDRDEEAQWKEHLRLKKKRSKK